MINSELQDIHNYWKNKYPNVDIRLWSNENKSKYFGQMLKEQNNVHFQADTIGELIHLCESFLRKVRM